jgi:hypothetical protein
MKWFKTHKELTFTIFLQIFFIITIYFHYFIPLNDIGLWMDSDFFLAWRLALSDALQQGEVLFWNPYQCGGVPGLENPQSRALAPLNILALLHLNPVTQIKIELLMHFVLCAYGCILVCKYLNFRTISSVLLFMLLSGNGFVVFFVLSGQPTFFPLLLAPLFFALLVKPPLMTSKRTPASFSKKWAMQYLVGGIFVAFVLLEDGIHALIFLYFFLGIFALTQQILVKNTLPLKRLCVWAMIGLGLTLFRTWPIIQLLMEHPRIIDSSSYWSLEQAWNALFNLGNRDLTGVVPDGDPKYYLGILILVLAILGFVKRRDPKVWGISIASVFAGVLMLGSFNNFAPWAMIHHLPIFDMLRFPFRFIIVFIWGLGLLAIYGSEWLAQKAGSHELFSGKNLFFWVIFLIICISWIDTYRVQTPLLSTYMTPSQDAPRYINRDIAFQYTNQRVNQYNAVAHNTGCLDCYRALHLPNAVSLGPPITFLNGNGRIHLSAHPNRFELIIDSSEALTFTLNQNFNKNWEIDSPLANASLANHDGLLKIETDSKTKALTLRYKSNSFKQGLWLSFFFLLGLLMAIQISFRKEQTNSHKDEH